MKLLTKAGVRVGGLSPELAWAMGQVREVFMQAGFPFVVTSCTEPWTKHKAGSLHYDGMAFDCRCPSHPESGGVPADDGAVMASIHVALGEEYDVILEGAGTPGASAPHIHVEFDPPVPKSASVG